MRTHAHWRGDQSAKQFGHRVMAVRQETVVQPLAECGDPTDVKCVEDTGGNGRPVVDWHGHSQNMKVTVKTASSIRHRRDRPKLERSYRLAPPLSLQILPRHRCRA